MSQERVESQAVRYFKPGPTSFPFSTTCNPHTVYRKSFFLLLFRSSVMAEQD